MTAAADGQTYARRSSCAGGRSSRMGGGDKSLRTARRSAAAGDHRSSGCAPQVGAIGDQRQWRPGPLRRVRAAGSRRHGAGLSRSAGRHSGRHATGRTASGCRRTADDRRRHAVPSGRSRRPAAGRSRDDRRARSRSPRARRRRHPVFAPVAGRARATTCAASWPTPRTGSVSAFHDRHRRRRRGVSRRCLRAAMTIDPFFNVNTPDDLAEAERLIARSVGA